MAAPPIDLDELNEIMDNDRDLMRECLDDFLSDYPNLMDELRTAVDALRFEDVENTAHKIKGMLRYLAAGPAAEAAFAVEKAGRLKNPENLTDKLAVLASQCSQTMDFINTLH